MKLFCLAGKVVEQARAVYLKTADLIFELFAVSGGSVPLLWVFLVAARLFAVGHDFETFDGYWICRFDLVVFDNKIG